MKMPRTNQRVDELLAITMNEEILHNKCLEDEIHLHVGPQISGHVKR